MHPITWTAGHQCRLTLTSVVAHNGERIPVKEFQGHSHRSPASADEDATMVHCHFPIVASSNQLIIMMMSSVLNGIVCTRLHYCIHCPTFNEGAHHSDYSSSLSLLSVCSSNDMKVHHRQQNIWRWILVLIIIAPCGMIGC